VDPRDQTPRAGAEGSRAADAQRALVIEDAPDVAFLVCETLRQAGFDTSVAENGAQALKLAEHLQPDLVTLDLMLPDLDGIEVCRRLRSVTNAYIIMLTGRTEEADRLVGLEMGADDYMAKPFSPRELRARVGAMFRRPRLADPYVDEEVSPALRSGDLIVDLEARVVTMAGEPVDLTRTEFDLLVLFVTRPRRVWVRETLRRQVWDTEWLDDHVIDVHIANLRRKLGDDARQARWIRTVRGVGYRFGGPDPGS
jgi:DNA-binding response OmpR family regulator